MAPNPEGSLSFGGGAFRSLALDLSDPTANFAIDNVTDAPEPASMILFVLGAIAFVGMRKLLWQP